MTLKEIEDRLRCKYGIDYEVLADALRAERERIAPILAWAEKATECPDCGEPMGSHANHCVQVRP